MGEVYRARDTRLDRTVAIKVLPAALSADALLRDRFDREARAISSLNHPHICALFDVGHQDGIDFLVLEYLEGETLADRLRKGALPVEQVLRVAVEIAEALDAAHRRGIVHRDLKPGNVMLTNDGAKLLDFGLAKRHAVLGQPVTGSASLTKSLGLTAEGTILGTLHYMSPEQLEGKEADARSDLFAFGAILYEVVTGKRAFDGDSPASVIAAILNTEPPSISTLKPLTPPLLDHIIRKCLAKASDDRWQNAQDVASELRWLAESGSQPSIVDVAASSWKHRIAAATGVVGLLVGILIGAALWGNSRRQSAGVPAAITRSIVALPAGVSLGSALSERSIALSPDGSRIAFVGTRGNTRQIYLRALEEFDSTPIAGTELDVGGGDPFFSPDGEWLGFFAGGKLKKVAISGGALETICECLGSYGTWGPDDTIIFSPSSSAGLFRVAGAGGTPQVVTRLDEQEHEKSHRFPQFLPDGKTVLFTIVPTDITSFEEARIALLSLDTGKRRVLFKGGSNPKFVSTGHVIYARGASLYAVPFDLRRLEITGQPAPVMDGVHASAEYGFADFSLAANGSLAYIPGGLRESDRSVVWVDSQGRTESLMEDDVRRPFQGVSLSPDGQRLALTVGGANDQMWLYDFARRGLTRLTFAADNFVGAWMPDGRRIAFKSDRTGRYHYYVANVDGSGEAEQVTDGMLRQGTGSWSPGGKVLVFDECCRAGWDIGLLTVQPERSVRPLIQTRFDETHPRLSPDGRWLAYVSNESGRPEVYVQPFPALGAKWQISNDGSTPSMPAWQPNGRELFYINGNKLMAVAIQTQPTFVAGAPRLLFEGSHVADADYALDVAPDGRFIMIKTGQTEAPAMQIAIIQNWFDELKRRVPTN